MGPCLDGETVSGRLAGLYINAFIVHKRNNVNGHAYAHRLHFGSFLGLPYKILNMNPKKGTTMESLGTCKYAYML